MHMCQLSVYLTLPVMKSLYLHAENNQNLEVVMVWEQG